MLVHTPERQSHTFPTQRSDPLVIPLKGKPAPSAVRSSSRPLEPVLKRASGRAALRLIGPSGVSVGERRPLSWCAPEHSAGECFQEQSHLPAAVHVGSLTVWGFNAVRTEQCLSVQEKQRRLRHVY